MTKTAGAAAGVSIELGTIQASLALKTDSLRTSIPKGDYMVDITLASSTYQTSTETHTHSGGAHSQYKGDGVHSHDGGAHSHRLPENFRGLKAGDRVLVAWCGNEPVVVAILTSS